MTPLQMSRCEFLTALLLAVAATVAAPQTTTGQETKPPFPGAKLLHKFPNEVFRHPTLVDSKAGPRLFLRLDSKDPGAAKTLIEAERNFNARDREFVVWDVAASKEVVRLSSKKKEAAADFEFRLLTADGKKLAYIENTGFTDMGPFSQVKLYDPTTRKSLAFPVMFFEEAQIQAFFLAPDGAAVIVHSTAQSLQCTVLEIGKTKPRKTFVLKGDAFSRLPLFQTAALSPNGGSLAVAVQGLISVYDLKTGKLIFGASRAAPEIKEAPVPGALPPIARLAFSPSTKEPKLLAYEIISAKPSEYSGLARVFDLKTNKETTRSTLLERTVPAGKRFLADQIQQATVCFNTKAEPRVLFLGRYYDVVANKVLIVGDTGGGLSVSDDLKYAVRLVRNAVEKRKYSVEIWSVDLDR